jgi:hypothetical protein
MGSVFIKGVHYIHGCHAASPQRSRTKRYSASSIVAREFEGGEVVAWIGIWVIGPRIVVEQRL